MSERILADLHAAEGWLHSLISGSPREQAPAARLRAQHEGLERLRAFLDFAGNPQDSFASIHVAGTSGKGSVTTLIAAILTQAGQRTGHHVSPYLQVSTEKLMLDGRRASAAEFVDLVRELRSLHERWLGLAGAGAGLSYSQAWMALAALWLARSRVDWAVVEAQVGGRYDPSNVLPASLAVITNVELDHVDVLGPGLRDIAWHKAGIIKARQTAVTGVTDPSALGVLRDEARARAARLHVLGEDFEFDLRGLTAQGTRFSVRTPRHAYEDLSVALPGKFQAVNAALAVTAVDLIAEQCGLSVTRDVLQAALQGARFPGRLEVVQHEPLVILDGAHNPHKMGALVETLQALHPGRRAIVVLGLLASKDAEAVLAALVPLAQRWIVTQPRVLGKPALAPAELAAAVRRAAPGADVETAERVDAGLERALQLAESESLVLVTGSLYMLGEARNRWVSPETLLTEP
jgi:dihydrofolate synthase/folylpolyglutamate synthase